MLQQQLQLQNPLPVDDMNMTEAPVKSGFGGQNQSSSEGFEQALSQSQNHQQQARQSKHDEPKAAKEVEPSSNNNKEQPESAAAEEPSKSSKAPSNEASNEKVDSETATHTEQPGAEDTPAKLTSSVASAEQNLEPKGQETAAEDALKQQVEAIQDLVTELSGEIDLPQLKALLADLKETLKELAPQLKQAQGKADVEIAKLEMALNKVSEFVVEQPVSDQELQALGQQIQQQIAQVTQDLKQDLNQKSAALDKIIADLETDSQQAQWLATIAAMVKTDKPESSQDGETDTENAVPELAEKSTFVQHQLNLEAQTLSQAKYEVNIDIEQLSLKDMVVFEPVAQSLVKQVQLQTVNQNPETTKTHLASPTLNRLSVEQQVDETEGTELAQKGEKAADKQGPITGDIVLPKLSTKSEGNTTAQALAQLTANLQGTDIQAQGQEKVDSQQVQMNDFSREKFLSELSSSPTLMRSLQVNAVNLDIETPVVKTQVEVQGVQLDKTLAQPKLESIQNAKQEGMIRENILFNKNELAANMQTQVGLMMARNMKSVDIRLDPPELGSIQVRLSVTNEQAAVSFVVSSQQAKDALEGSMNRLKELLEQEGLNLADTDVKQENSGKERGQEGDEQGQFAGTQLDEDGIEVTDPALTEKIRQINSPWNVDFYA